jgi:hypothetical protein
LTFFKGKKSKIDLSIGKKQYIAAIVINFLGIDRIYYNSIYKNEACFSKDDKNSLVKILKDLPILKFIAIKSMKDVNNEKYANVINIKIEREGLFIKFHKE